jgi:hypothetical protein
MISDVDRKLVESGNWRDGFGGVRPGYLIVYYYPQEIADFWRSAGNRIRSGDLRGPQLFWTGGVLQCERKKNDRSEKR